LNQSQYNDAQLPTRRRILKTGAAFAGAAALSPLHLFASQSPSHPQTVRRTNTPQVKIFDVLKYGAAGDGKTLDSAAFQRAIDEAAACAGKAQVLVRGGHKYLIGTIELKGSIDFHLADDAELLASTRSEDYRGGLPGSVEGATMAAALGAVITATNAQGLTISGTGSLQGRAREFMKNYDKVGQWWVPGPFRPKMFVLIGCKDLTVRDITFAEAPNWGLHMLGCDGVLIDGIKIRNLLDVPNCDGIDPDHSRNVEIRNCDIVAGDDGIVIKCSHQPTDFGDAANIHVHDCTIDTQDAGLKIGTETTSDIHDIRFERITIKRASRGLCIQLRDEGNIYNIDYRDITLNSRFFANPWWGRGEAISLTAIPRTPTTKLCSLHHITATNIACTAENSIRVCGSANASAAPRIHDVTLDRVAITLARTTGFKGGLFDNRPTTVAEPGSISNSMAGTISLTKIDPDAPSGIILHDTPGFSIEHADNITLRNCTVTWGANPPDAFSYAVEAVDTTGLKIEGLTGTAAHPALGKAVSIS
jgi:polygalacturonase